MSNQELVNLVEELSPEFVGKQMNDVADLIRDQFRQVLRIPTAKGTIGDPFETVMVPDKSGVQIPVLKLRSLSNIIKAYVEDKFTEEQKTERTAKKKELINRAKYYGLANYIEVGLRAMGYRSVLKGVTKAGEVGFGLQQTKQFEGAGYEEFANKEKALENRREKARLNKAKLQANPALEANFKALQDAGVIDAEMEIELLEG